MVLNFNKVTELSGKHWEDTGRRAYVNPEVSRDLSLTRFLDLELTAFTTLRNTLVYTLPSLMRFGLSDRDCQRTQRHNSSVAG